ncbi:hypothetical protein V3W46_02420 [Subtercola sp. YIM 133946]
MPGGAAARVIAAAVVLVAGAGWALTVILSPAAGVSVSDDFTLVTAVEGDVGAHLTLNVAAQWNLQAVGTNEAAGVVTSVDLGPGQLVDEGARLYSVNQRPVVVAEGDVPAYRAIGPGDSGADVAQLQRMLARLGFYGGDAGAAGDSGGAGGAGDSGGARGAADSGDGGDADGHVGASTVAAISAWQRSLGEDAGAEGASASAEGANATVAFGDVIFVPRLPARLALKPDVVTRGATLAGGEPVLQWLGESPVFTLPVSTDQSALVSTGTRVLIDDGSGDTWQAVTAGRAESTSGTVVVALVPAPTDATPPSDAAAPAQPPGSANGAQAGPICAADCDAVPVVGQTLFVSRVVTVETAHGTVVPSAALRSTADQTVIVIDAGGSEHAVRVTTASQGLAVVSGIDPGLVVRVAIDAGQGDAASVVTGPAATTPAIAP